MSDLLALFGIIVAIVLGLGAAAVALYIHRREHPYRRFSHSVRTSPLVSRQLHGLPKLTVAYDGSTVLNPYLVTIEIASTGRADISSASFDGQKPILFQLNVPVLVEIEQTPSTDSVSARLVFAPGDSTIKLAPALLPKQFSIRATYLCDGKPANQPRIELADITIRDETLPRLDRNPDRTSRRLWLGMGGVAGVIAILALLQAITGWTLR